MTRAVVVYESLYGNGQTVAAAIVERLTSTLDATSAEAALAPTVFEPDVSLLVVGGPNHQMGMTRRSSRESAVQEYGEPILPIDFGLREWFDSITEVPYAPPAAAYDTRLREPGLLRRIDHASKAAERKLKRLGCRLLAPAEHFLVASPTGPLVPGEEERAVEWGRHLASRLGPISAPVG